jgi:hypothetical protein
MLGACYRESFPSRKMADGTPQWPGELFLTSASARELERQPIDAIDTEDFLSDDEYRVERRN